MQQLEQQLVDGHWVLAFEDAESAEAAAQHVGQQAELAKSLLREVLQPLA